VKSRQFLEKKDGKDWYEGVLQEVVDVWHDMLKLGRFELKPAK
jgi:hypothetical protein